VETSDGTRLPLKNDAEVQDGQPITYGIRPEHIALGDGGISADIDLIEPTGAETLLFSTIAGVELCTRTMERRNVAPGDNIGLIPDRDHVLLFNAQTGARV
jgi:multiple sugar transport system ATP-binding protein